MVVIWPLDLHVCRLEEGEPVQMADGWGILGGCVCWPRSRGGFGMGRKKIAIESEKEQIQTSNNDRRLSADFPGLLRHFASRCGVKKARVRCPRRIVCQNN